MVLEVEFIIVGGQRSGSTFLAEALASHSEVHVPYLELPTFEDPFVTVPTTIPKTQEILDEYGRDLVRGLKRPDLLHHPEAPDRVLRQSSARKILAAVRDPVDRAWSAIHWYQYTNRLPMVDPNTLLLRAVDEVGANPRRYPVSSEEHWLADVLAAGEYGRHLESWADRFGAEHVLAVRSHDLLALAGAAWDRIFEFLDVSSEALHRSTRAKNSVVYDPVRLRWLRLRGASGFSWSTASAIEDHESYFRRHPLKLVRNAIVHGVDRAILARTHDAPVARQSDVSSALRSFYSADQGLLTSASYFVEDSS